MPPAFVTRAQLVFSIPRQLMGGWSIQSISAPTLEVKKDIRKLVKNDNDFFTKFKNVASSDNKDMIFKLFAKDEHPFGKPHNIINYDSLVLCYLYAWDNSIKKRNDNQWRMLFSLST